MIYINRATDRLHTELHSSHQDFATTGFDIRNIVGNMLEMVTNASSDKPCNIWTATVKL